MARKLEVEIIGDSRSLERAFGRSASAAGGFGSKVKSAGKVAGLAAAGGIAALGVGLKKSLDAAKEAEVSQKKLQAQLKALGISYKEHGGIIDDTLRKQSQLSAFDDEELSDSFTQLVRATGDVNKALELNALTMDLARAKGMSLEAAAMMVTKAQMGQLGALRRSGIEIEKVTTAQDALGKGASKAAQEQAKAADLAATKQQAITLLQEKFAGQAKAYGETAAGAQERFGVALENLGEVIGGKVLPHMVPLINGLTNFINKAAESERLKEIFRITGEVIAKTFQVIKTVVETVGPVVVRAFGMAKKAAQDVAEWYKANLEPAIRNVITAITVIWRRFGDDIVKIISKALGILKTIISTTIGNIASVIQAFLAILRGDWSTAWNEIKEIPGRTLRGMVSVIKGMVGIFLDAAKALGKALIDGIVAGVSGLASALADKIKGSLHSAIDSVKSGFGIFSPSKVTAEEIGAPLAEGISLGFITAMGPFSEKAKEKVLEAIEAARSAIESKKSAFADAFGELSSQALAAFDKLTSDFQTKTEKKMARQDEARAAAGRQQALTDAQSGLATAMAGGDQEAILQAQRTLAEAEFAIQRAKDEKIAAQERAKYEERRALQRRHFEERLAALNQSFANQEISAKQFNQRLIALFKAHEIPFNKAALKLGGALAEGLRDAMKDARKAAQDLAQAIMNQLSNIKVVVQVDVRSSDPLKPPGKALGGPVTGGVPIMVGEQGPELFVPSGSGKIVPNNAVGSGGGGITVNVYNAGSVTSDRDLVTMIRNALIQEGRRNGGNLLGGYA